MTSPLRIPAPRRMLRPKPDTGVACLVSALGAAKDPHLDLWPRQILRQLARMADRAVSALPTVDVDVLRLSVFDLRPFHSVQVSTSVFSNEGDHQ